MLIKQIVYGLLFAGCISPASAQIRVPILLQYLAYEAAEGNRISRHIEDDKRNGFTTDRKQYPELNYDVMSAKVNYTNKECYDINTTFVTAWNFNYQPSALANVERSRTELLVDAFAWSPKWKADGVVLNFDPLKEGRCRW